MMLISSKLNQIIFCRKQGLLKLNCPKNVSRCLFLIILLSKTIMAEFSGEICAFDQENNCVKLPSETRVTFPKWPFLINCSKMLPNLDPSSVQCCLKRDDQFFDLPTKHLNLSVSEVFNTFLVHNNGSCWSQNISIEIRPLALGSDFESIKDDILNNNSNVVYESALLGSEVYHRCLPPSNEQDEYYSLALPPVYNVTWWKTPRNRNGMLSNDLENYTATALLPFPGVPMIVPGTDLPYSIKDNDVNYYDPGVYSCELEYNGQSAFIIHQSLCVANEFVDRTPPHVTCTTRTTFVEEQTIAISCTVSSSNAKVEAGQLVVQWGRKDHNGLGCEYRYKIDDEQNRSDERYSCPINFSNVDLPCFEYEPSNAEARAQRDRNDFVVYFNIKDARRSDAGEYFVRVKYGNRTSSDELFVFIYDLHEQLLQIITILVTIIGILLAVIIATFIIWRYWIQIQLFIRRHFGKYDEDDKEYVAILSYVFTNEPKDDLEKASTQDYTKKIVSCIQQKMTDLKYAFYDSHKDFELGSSIENLLNNLNKSHRMIVILTDAYVDERWSRFEAQQGFKNMMKNRTKLIFIRIPGAKKAVKKSKGDFSKELNDAMKASRNIKWTEKMSDERLKNHVHYALPNLKR